MTIAEFEQFSTGAGRNHELLDGELHISNPDCASRTLVDTLAAALNQTVGEDYLAVAGLRFRLGAETILQPDIAVISRDAYKKERLFHPGLAWLDIVPVLAVLLSSPPADASRLARAFAAYRSRGTGTLWLANSETRSVSVLTERGLTMHFDTLPLPHPFAGSHIPIPPLFDARARDERAHI